MALEGLGRLHLFGSSWGGMLAMPCSTAWAAREVSRVPAAGRADS